MTDQCIREVPLTPEELRKWRADQVAFHEQMCGPLAKFTCDDCAGAPKCKLAFDSYNTDGDCLYEK